jgi:hypothetical protein
VPVTLYWRETCAGGTEAGGVRGKGSGKLSMFKWHEVTGEYRRLHNEGRHDLYATSRIIRVMK